MIFKGKDFIQYASNKQITFDKLPNPASGNPVQNQPFLPA